MSWISQHNLQLINSSVWSLKFHFHFFTYVLLFSLYSTCESVQGNPRHGWKSSVLCQHFALISVNQQTFDHPMLSQLSRECKPSTNQNVDISPLLRAISNCD